MANKIILSFIGWISLYFICTTFTSVFLEESVDEKQRAYENIQHQMVDATEATILLKTSEVQLVLDKSKQHYLEQWRAKNAHFFMSVFTFLSSLILLFKEIKSKNREI